MDLLTMKVPSQCFLGSPGLNDPIPGKMSDLKKHIKPICSPCIPDHSWLPSLKTPGEVGMHVGPKGRSSVNGVACDTGTVHGTQFFKVQN